MPGKAIEFERLDVRERLRCMKAGDVGNGRMSAQIQENAVAIESAYAAVLQAHFNSLRTDEAALAKDQFGAASLVLVHVHADEAVNHPPLASSHSAISIDAGAVPLPKSRS